MKTFKFERLNLSTKKMQTVIKTSKQLTSWDKKIIAEGGHVLDIGYDYKMTKIK